MGTRLTEYAIKFDSFDGLRRRVGPLLLENKEIIENGHLEIAEAKVLDNSRKLHALLEKNLSLLQSHPDRSYSNLELVLQYLTCLSELMAVGGTKTHCKHIPFQEAINSIFGISPIKDSLFPFVETVEALIGKLQKKEIFETVVLGEDVPYISFKEDGRSVKVYLDDTPRVRQLFYDYKCHKPLNVRLDTLNFAFKFMKSRGAKVEILDFRNLREVILNGIKLIFVYEHSFGNVMLRKLSPEENSVVVNLYNWNGNESITNEARKLAEKTNVTLLTMDDFYSYISNQKYIK